MPRPCVKDLPTTPHIATDEAVLLFDGVCKLCNGAANFIIRHDHQKRVKLCNVQSSQGQDILAHFGMPLDQFSSMVYVHNNAAYIKSEACFALLPALGFPWTLLNLFSVLPRTLCDRLYDRVADNRYRWFGKFDQCITPSADQADRFLNSK